MENDQKCLLKAESELKMDQKIAATSLLSLNEYCLIEVFEYLKLADLMNLEKTCTQLKFVAARVCAQKYKKLEIMIIDNNKSMKSREFSDILSVIGEHIESVSLENVNQLILQLIKDNCKNINSLDLWRCAKPVQLQCFENLKQLKLNAVRITTNELKVCFTRNAELECLEYDCSYGDDFLELLDMLPKLKSLHLDNVPNNLHLNKHLHCLDGLTKFSFYSPANCNQLLIKLSNNANLMELHVWMPLDAESFGIIKSFPSLKNLSMHQIGQLESLPAKTVFPSTLKSIKLTGIRMTCKTLFSTVKQLKLLEEFDIGYRHDVDKSLNFNDTNVISHVALEMKPELVGRKRPLNFVYYDRQATNKQRYIYNSSQLRIENAHAAAAWYRPKSQRITVTSFQIERIIV